MLMIIMKDHYIIKNLIKVDVKSFLQLNFLKFQI